MDEYYEQYLKDHAHPKCKLMHFIGQLATIGYVIYIIWYQYWLLLLAAPLVVYPFAIGGHILFGCKGNKPSFFTMSFLQAKRCDVIMFIDILRGKLKIW